MKRSRLIPFYLTPASWGLKGPARDEAEIAYYYEGEEMERQLAKHKHTDATAYAKAAAAIDLKYNKLSQYQYDVRMLEIEGKSHDQRAALMIDFKHKKIDEYTFGQRLIAIEKDGVEREVALLDHDLEHGVITEREHAKQTASAQKKPWVGIVSDDFNINLGTSGFSIELDWNDEWIDYLKLNGYTGITDEEIVDQWFSDVTASQTGQFAAVTGNPAAVAAHQNFFAR